MSIGKNTSRPRGPLQPGQTRIVMDEVTEGAGSSTEKFVIEADSILVSLFASTVDAELDVVVSTYTETGKEVDIITFPQLTAATTNLVIRKAAATMSNIIIRATYTGAAEFEVRARGIGTGEASVRILAANEAKASQTDVSTTPVLLVPAALNDRAGLVVKNNNFTAGHILYVGFSLAEATAAVGYPLGPQEALGIDVAAGQEVYAVGTTSIDVRIMEASS